MIRVILLSALIIFSGCKDAKPIQTNLITKPMLWKISKKGTKDSYLFGTYHTKNPNITSLNPTILGAFKASDKLYTELALSDDEATAINKFAMLHKPIPLKNRLSQKTIDKIKKTAPSTSISELASLKTWAIAIVLDSKMEKSEYEKLPIMDERLILLAKNDKKERGALEEWREQLGSLDKLTEPEQEELVSITLDITEPNERVSVEKWYLDGDIGAYDELEKKFINGSKLYKKIMVESRTNRSATMARRIDIILSSNPNRSYFFAIGAAHMPSSDGLITLLKSKGYEITRAEK
jgi:uncharacterized protein YbaP (TraB family)